MQAPSATGRLVRIENMPLRHVAPRHIDIWLPDNFDTLKNQGQKFNVIYMHDSLMSFDARTT